MYILEWFLFSSFIFPHQESEMPKWLESKFAAMSLNLPWSTRRSWGEPRLLSSDASSDAQFFNEEHYSSFSSLFSTPQPPAEPSLKLFECAFCHVKTSSRIYQCKKGYLYCHDCKFIVKAFPNCSEDINDSGGLLQHSVKYKSITCSHAGFGCDFMPHPLDLESHLMTCIYRPCPCPSLGCHFRGPSDALWQHLRSFHCSSSEICIWNNQGYEFQFKKKIMLSLYNNDVLLRCRSASSCDLRMLLHVEVKAIGVFVGFRCFTEKDKEKDFSVVITLKKREGRLSTVRWEGKPKSMYYPRDDIPASSMFRIRKRFLQVNSCGQFAILFELKRENKAC